MVSRKEVKVRIVHVVDTAGSSHNHMHSVLELHDVIADTSSTNAAVALNTEVVSKSEDNLNSSKKHFRDTSASNIDRLQNAGRLKIGGHMPQYT